MGADNNGNIYESIYEQISDLIRVGDKFVFCRITKAEGSTPRKAGAVMSVKADRTTIGSVGGGKPEFECIEKAREILTKTGQPETLHFDLNHGDPESDYICGGKMDIELIPVFGDDEELDRDLLRWLGSRKKIKVYIFGGGHVAQALVPVLAKLEFEPVVYEERGEFTEKELFPQATEIICAGFERLGDRISLEDDDYAAIMTRGHIDDYAVLKQVLSTRVKYIGLMGSRAKRKILFEKLKEDGFVESDIARIHNPIGIDIGSETPDEIAISIAAEMIAVRSGKKVVPQPPEKDTVFFEGDPEKEHWGEVAALFARKAGVKGKE